MKPHRPGLLLCGWLAGSGAGADLPAIRDIEMAPHLTIESPLGVTNRIEYTNQLSGAVWVELTNWVVSHSPYEYVDRGASRDAKRFYRVAVPGSTTELPPGMVLVPTGTFQMGDNLGEGSSVERPAHTVEVNGFYMDKTEVSQALWAEVWAWALAHGYGFENAGIGKASNHPATCVSWYDAVKWCNARSEKEGRTPACYTGTSKVTATVYRTGIIDVLNDWVHWDAGYRLPTEAEWEYAAQGGVDGRRFPSGDTISHSQANYFSSSDYAYDVSSTRGYHPGYATGAYPYTSPVGTFAPNGYGLYDMAGNVEEWCWDWWDPSYYASSPGSNPRGPSGGFGSRVIRGGGWYDSASSCRVRSRSLWPDYGYIYYGFRSVLPQGR